MPITTTYPGVYVEEIPSGVHTITGVGTSTAAFIDFFKQGPMDQAVEINGVGDFERIFGGLDDRSEAGYAITQFFLNGGSHAYVVRVAKDNSGGGKPLATASVIVKNGADIIKISAANPGVWGNALRAEIDYNTLDPTSLFNLKITRYASADADALPVGSETFINLSMDASHPRYAVAVVNDQSKLAVLTRLTAVGTNTLPMAVGLIGGDLSGLLLADFNGLSGKKFKLQIGGGTAKTVTLGTWANGAVTDLLGLRPKLEAAVQNADPQFADAAVEIMSGDVVAGVTKQYFRILVSRQHAGYAPAELLTATEDGQNTAKTLKLLDADLYTKNVREYPLGGSVAAGSLKVDVTGGDGDKPGATEIIGSRAAEPFTGMYALEHADLFNILCIPRAAELDDTQLSLVVGTAEKYCEEKRAFMIVDIPSTVDEVEKMKVWMSKHDTLRHKNTALYFPRLKQVDPENDYRLRNVAASGTMAGLYARIDTARGVWKAPAGTEATLAGVVELDADLTDPQNGVLNPLAINCFRDFPIYGNVCWGGRTLDGSDQAASDWKYIPIRRLTLFLEESLFRGTKWVVFEPNDEPLWAKIRLNINAFMLSLFNQGAFQGSTPTDAFYVKCDAETTTQDDRNKGIVNIQVGFAPLKPAEFVIIQIQQIAGKL